MRKSFRKRKFISNQNGAVFQYKIPYQGSFAITVRYLHNSKRKFIQKIVCFMVKKYIPIYLLIACNIMAEGLAPYYVLQNFGSNRNCTLISLFPAVVSVEAIEVGAINGNVNYDVSRVDS